MTCCSTLTSPAPPLMTYHLSPTLKSLIFSRAWSLNHPQWTSYLHHLLSLVLMFSPTLLHTWPTCPLLKGVFRHASNLLWSRLYSKNLTLTSATFLTLGLSLTSITFPKSLNVFF